MTSLPDELVSLSVLSEARKSAVEYYAPLTLADDEVLRVGAFVALCDRKLLPYKLQDACLVHARHGGVKFKAFEYFQFLGEHGLAARVAATESEPETAAVTAMAEAWLVGDQVEMAGACRRLFLATGNLDLLLQEQNFLYLANGPSRAIPAGIRNLILNPHGPILAIRLFQLCADANRPDLIDGLGALLAEHDLHPLIALAYSAAASLLRKSFTEARDKLTRIGGLPSNAAASALLGGTLSRLRAETLEGLGDFGAAYQALRELKRPKDGSSPDLTSYRTIVTAESKKHVPQLPPDPRHNWFVLTGFPRSGTTLLENALSAHPAIETFEELPAEAAMQSFLQRTSSSDQSFDSQRDRFIEAREIYYAEMERRRHKRSANMFVDKLPLRSAKARFFSRMFPAKRYIFSIRHPYDVVLSCFKQDFAPNIAMENFRTIEGAIGLYDFSMTQWFSVFGMDDPRVHYLRYDDLITDFEPRMRAVLAFVGVGWDDAIRNFAEAAQGRASITPSYQKVRQGIKIGIQTSWRNYAFLFQTPAAKPLQKWAEFFGYPTE